MDGYGLITKDTGLFTPEDVALIEHNFIHEQIILEWKPEDLQFYLSGVHDFAEEIISRICETNNVLKN